MYINCTSKKVTLKNKSWERQRGIRAPTHRGSGNTAGAALSQPCLSLFDCGPQGFSNAGTGPPGPGTCSPASGSVQAPARSFLPSLLGLSAGLSLPRASKDILNNVFVCPGESKSGRPSQGVLSLSGDRGSAGMTTSLSLGPPYHHQVQPKLQGPRGGKQLAQSHTTSQTAVSGMDHS